MPGTRAGQQSRGMHLRNRKQRTARRIAQGSSRHQPLASANDAVPGEERVYEDREDAAFDPSGDRAPASDETTNAPKARQR